MARHRNDLPQPRLLPEKAGSKPDAPLEQPPGRTPEEATDSGLLEEEAGCPAVICGGRRMTAPPGSAHRCGPQGWLRLVT
jgi:hypothetical protein